MVLGNNYLPEADNFPASSFPTPVPVPLVAPDDEGNLIYVQYNADWIPVLEAAATQLLNPATWQGTDDEKRQAVIDADLLMYLLQEPAAVVPELSPYWDDPDAEDATGGSDVSTFTYEDVEDWIITAFLVISGVPGAAIVYRTIAPRFRLAMRTHDAGGIVKIFLDNILYAEVDTYSAIEAVTEIDVFVP